MIIDIISLQIVAVIGSLVSGVIFLLPGVASDESGGWARWWGLGKLVIGFANCTILVYERDALIQAEAVSNIAIMIGLLMLVYAAATFADRSLARTVTAPLTILLAVVAGIAILSPADPRWSMTSMGMGRSVALAAIAWFLLGVARAEKLYTAWIMGSLFVVAAGLFAGRAVLMTVWVTDPQAVPILLLIAIWALAIAIVIVTLSNFSLLLIDAERSQRLLREQAFRDSLTGAMNRFGLTRLISALRGTVSVLLIDVDRFKALNDGLGHAAGDAVLRLLSNLAEREMADSGTLVRIGGDEFLCVLPGFSRVDAQSMAARISDRFDRALPATVEGPHYPTLSIGIGHGLIEDGFDRLTREADAAMYAMKEQRYVKLPTPRAA